MEIEGFIGNQSHTSIDDQRSNFHTMDIFSIMLSFSITGLVVLLFLLCSTYSQAEDNTKKSDPNDNKGLTPFFLQDPYDQSCLGPNGFTQCDENSLWYLTKRNGKKTYSLVSFMSSSSDVCLQRERKFFGLFGTDKLILGSCKKGAASLWEWEFLDQIHVKIGVQGMCIVKGRSGLKSSVSLKICNKGEYLPLIYHPTTVHEEGFYLKAPDGSCFDGSYFRSCVGSGAQKLLWGMGVRYVKGEAKRYFFNFSERTKCIVPKGTSIAKDTCSVSSALGWGLSNGRITYNSVKCLARKLNDEAVLVPCPDGYETIALEVPAVYANEAIPTSIEEIKVLG